MPAPTRSKKKNPSHCGFPRVVNILEEEEGEEEEEEEEEEVGTRARSKPWQKYMRPPPFVKSYEVGGAVNLLIINLFTNFQIFLAVLTNSRGRGGTPHRKSLKQICK